MADEQKSKRYVPRKEKFKGNIIIKDRIPWTKKQIELFELLDDKQSKCVFVSGPAGTSKTLSAVYCALKSLKEKKISEIVYIRSPVESSKRSLGMLPGEIENKFGPYSTPLDEKLLELIDINMIDNLKLNGHIQACPINYLRGRSFADSLVIVDECQNIYYDELVTIITRIGEQSRIWFLGDPEQSDLPNGHKIDFINFKNAFSDLESESFGIKVFHFGSDDIVRSEFCKFVVRKLRENKFS